VQVKSLLLALALVVTASSAGYFWRAAFEPPDSRVVEAAPQAPVEPAVQLPKTATSGKRPPATVVVHPARQARPGRTLAPVGDRSQTPSRAVQQQPAGGGSSDRRV